MCVDEVRDHLDAGLAGQAKSEVGLLCQPTRRRGDSIRSQNREPGEGRELGIRTDAGDVRAMQGDKQLGCARAQDLAGQVGAQRVGNGVVNMEKVQAFRLRHFDHLGRQGQGI